MFGVSPVFVLCEMTLFFSFDSCTFLNLLLEQSFFRVK